MISVIVPVYNVEPYLRKCLDSIVGQTYRDLEILVIDDGSTDGCGAICDEYAEWDERVRVFHTENRGLSAARNKGLDEATGEWIGFVDSDDWIEHDLFQKAIDKIGTADILCYSHHDGSYTGFEALVALINGKISTITWDKLYRNKCFLYIRFPEGRIIEDIATTYKIIHQSNQVACRNIRGYHHIFREDSLCQTHNLKNLFDYCLSTKEQYDYCIKVLEGREQLLSRSQMGEIEANLLKFRAYAIARAWAWRCANDPSDSPEWEKLSQEARTVFPYKVRKRFPLCIRGGLFLARFNHPFSFWIAHKVHIMTRKIPVNG